MSEEMKKKLGDEELNKEQLDSVKGGDDEFDENVTLFRIRCVPTPRNLQIFQNVLPAAHRSHL